MQKQEKGFAIFNGLIMCLVEDESVMVLPADTVELCEAVFQALYALALGGHSSHRKLEALGWRKFYWPKLGADVNKFCSQCDIY